jgi:hypothetical protein
MLSGIPSDLRMTLNRLTGHIIYDILKTRGMKRRLNKIRAVRYSPAVLILTSYTLSRRIYAPGIFCLNQLYTLTWRIFQADF